MHQALSHFQPNQPTDLARLAKVVRVVKADIPSLPSNLPDDLLISVARDLRAIEQPDQVEDHTLLSAPLFLVMDLNLKTRRVSSPDGMQMSQEEVQSDIRAYQWAVEREIVARMNGAESVQDEQTLLKATLSISV